MEAIKNRLDKFYEKISNLNIELGRIAKKTKSPEVLLMQRNSIEAMEIIANMTQTAEILAEDEGE